MYNDEFNSYHFTNRDDLPRDDYTPTPRPQPDLTPTPKKQGFFHRTWVKVTALVLACAVVGGAAGYGGSESYGGGYGGGYTTWNPFGGSARMSPMEAAKMYLNSGYYREALNLLASVGERDGEWYFISAVANYNLGNKTVALTHIREACRLDPTNAEYAQVLERMQQGGQVYSQRNAEYADPCSGARSCCLGYTLLNLISCCCCPHRGC